MSMVMVVEQVLREKHLLKETSKNIALLVQWLQPFVGDVPIRKCYVMIQSVKSIVSHASNASRIQISLHNFSLLQSKPWYIKELTECKYCIWWFSERENTCQRHSAGQANSIRDPWSDQLTNLIRNLGFNFKFSHVLQRDSKFGDFDSRIKLEAWSWRTDWRTTFQF